MANDLFRKSALEKLSSPEQLNQLIRITPPRSWIALSVLGLILVVILIWSILGSIPTSVSGQGIITNSKGVYDVVAIGSGVMHFSSPLKVGDFVTDGQVLARVSQPQIENQLQAGKDNLKRLQTDLDELTASVSRERTQAETVYQSEKGIEKEAIKAKEEELHYLQQTFQDQRKMLEKGFVSKQEHEKTKQQILDTQNQIIKLKELAINAMDNKLHEIAREEAELRTLRQQVDQASYQVNELESKLELAANVVAEKQGRIVEIKAGSGDVVQAGEPVFTIAPDSDNLIAIIYLPHTGQAKRVVPGIRAEISPVAYKKERYGYLIGRVDYVSPYPVSAAGMMPVLGNRDLVSDLTQEGAPVEVRVELLPDKTTRSGYQWSSSNGKGIELSGGSWCTGSFVVEKNRPIGMVFPLLKEAVGL